MKCVWCIVIAASAVLGLAGPSVAQTGGNRTQGNQTQGSKPSLYTTAPAPVLDPNYGLPAFSLPNYERPRPKAVTPEADGTAADLDFYRRAPESRFPLPRQAGRTRSSTTETPLYTTQEGMPIEDRLRTDTMEPDPMEADTFDGYPKTRR